MKATSTLDRRSFAAWLAAGALAPARAADAPRRIVASFSILADIAREIAPAGTEVHALVGPDADAHVYDATPADARRLAGADLVVVNGLGFEGWIDRLVQVSGHRGPLVVASAGVSPRRIGPAVDPHAWQDLRHAMGYAATLADAFARRWPEARDEIERRGARYRERLGALHERARAWIDSVPREERRVMTTHDAFGYFGTAYGVDFVAPLGWSTRSEPSAAAVARLIRQIREQRVRAVFVENIRDARLVDRIAREGGARLGGTLYSDALSQPGGPADTYLRLFEHNARSVAEALGAPR